MIPSSPEQQQRHAAKRVRFPSEDLSHVAHIDVVSREHRQEYWYTPAEYSVIEREIKQTVRRLRKRVAAEMKQENEFVSCCSSSLNCGPVKRQRHVLDTTKYCDRGLEDFVHHYETKQLKTTIAKVILAEQDIQRARGVHDPVALMQVSLACTQLSRQQAISLAEQDAEDVQRICGQPQQNVEPSDDACHFLFSKDITNICDDITRATSMSLTKENETPMRPPLTLLSICDHCDAPPTLIRSELPLSG